jgi:hypothetical protein
MQKEVELIGIQTMSNPISSARTANLRISTQRGVAGPGFLHREPETDLQ